MDKHRIIYLLKAYEQQTATPEERAEFAIILHDERYEYLFNQLLDQNWDELTSEEIDQIEIPGYDRILQEIKQQPQLLNRKKNWWPRMAIAAAILVIFSFGLYFYTSNLTTDNSQPIIANDIAPGKDGATLTLANGKKILIKEVLAGNIANESGVKITKNKDGQLIYEIVEDEDGPLSYNTLSTSAGEQTQVRLQDGTVVYLNAASSLKYPTSFAKAAKRQVSLTGEAYFEVAKDKQHPFLVEARHQTVEVLGTAFNINSYADEPTIKTTLLEGSVKVQHLLTHNSQLLKPGEQAIVNDKTIETKAIETEDVIAWKNGYFMFNNETLESIMKKVSRWYDADIQYSDNSIKRKTFFGSVSRSMNVSQVLKLMQNTGGITFEIKGRQIIVSQNKPK